ncbi:MAG: extracellular solute-binding protein [Rhodoferax sp.]|nr:MAG: extracellular solute-binding protein [Rhodoferax sp.]
MPSLSQLLRIYVLVLLGGLSSGGAWAQTLRVLAWPGYADPDIVRIFEERTGAKVEVSFVESDDQLWERMSAHGGKDFDVFAVNTAELQRYIDARLAAPIDTKALGKLGLLQPRFRKLSAVAGVQRKGQTYAIPYTYSEMGLIYDPQQWSTPPDSVNALWDPRVRGKVLMYNAGGHGFSLAAQRMGLKSPFALAPADWPRAVQELIGLRRNVRAYYTQPEESVALFLQHKAALMFANYGTQQVTLLEKAGAKVGYVIPREGALAWLDCWAVSSLAQGKPMVTAWLNFMLEKEAAQALVQRQGLSSATLTDRPLNERLVWLQPQEDAERRTVLWSRIVGGASAEKVMAP